MKLIKHYVLLGEKPLILLVGSIIGVLARIVVCCIFYNTQIALFAFGIANFVDFYTRSIIFRLCLLRGVDNQLEISAT